ncbi:hypothetical protein PISMIDRAFT_13780 [Pisolithus microcarpus 441]|uniref:Uncharacterized protein n=1 Tax=Pisolithus microcarpus 441 TaxID=765257 RepID=A0A0C9Y3H2_9AGAM|nr:hypothetical protein PISMIDRAFT_13780 [Pisolithus microcarpus 441]
MLHVHCLDKIESLVSYHNPKGAGTCQASTNSPGDTFDLIPHAAQAQLNLLSLDAMNYTMCNQDTFQPLDELMYSEAVALEEDRIATELMADYMYNIGND